MPTSRETSKTIVKRAELTENWSDGYNSNLLQNTAELRSTYICDKTKQGLFH